ncbi:MAG: hypothetical protein R3F61_14025 [Myxococcota bacterium]
MSDLTPWHSFRIRKAKSDAKVIIGAYGGHPRGIRAHQWPRCAVCGAPMCHMAQIEAGPWLDLGPHTRMTVFICHATGGRCEDWDPWKGANKVLLSKMRDENLYDGPPTVRVYRRQLLTVDQALDERAVMSQVRTHGVPVADALEQLRHDKLGGGAVWLHGDDTPASPTGQGPMRMLLQITTDLVKFDITSGGMGYVFLDPYDASENAGRLLWQGG